MQADGTAQCVAPRGAGFSVRRPPLSRDRFRHVARRLQIEGASFADDDEFRLVIPRRGDINARVRWASAGSAGAQIDEDLLLDDVVPARESYAIRRLRAFNFGSGRVFGRRGLPAE